MKKYIFAILFIAVIAFLILLQNNETISSTVFIKTKTSSIESDYNKVRTIINKIFFINSKKQILKEFKNIDESDLNTLTMKFQTINITDEEPLIVIKYNIIVKNQILPLMIGIK